jgi:cytochrome c-type biogenesis protein
MDFARAAIDASATRSFWAPGFAFVAGITSSFGPCIAPRFIAVAGVATRTNGLARCWRISAFAAGLCMAYVAIGTIAGALGYVAQYSEYIYVALALTLTGGGIATLARPVGSCSEKESAPAAAPGAAFLSGLAFASVASPCCGPIAAVLGGLSVASGGLALGATTLAAFALGHALPLVAFAGASVPVTRFFHAHSLTAALPVVGGALMIALGAYYAVLA